MPFDGVGFALDDRVSKMDKVIELLATSDKWCKGNLKTPDGRYCIRGAIMAVDGADFLQPIVLQAIREVTGKHYRRIESFNDHADTHYAQVVRVLARARHHLLRGQLTTDPAALLAACAGWRPRLQAWLNTISPKKLA
jgi:hypothetical protein